MLRWGHRKGVAFGTLAVVLVVTAGCGGDDGDAGGDETTTTTTTTTTSEPTTTTTVDDEEDAAGGGTGVEIARVDAHQATAQAAMRLAEGPEAELYFADRDDVECTAPDADQPDNLNERASRWSCTIESETNGYRCDGSTVVVGAGDADDPEAEVEDVDITCGPA